MTWLLDGNALVAMSLPGHAFFDRTHRWLASIPSADTIATCPVTEGTLLRLHMQYAREKSATAAWAALMSLHAHPRHVSWQENFSYAKIDPTRLTGHRRIPRLPLLPQALRREEKRGKLTTLCDHIHSLS